LYNRFRFRERQFFGENFNVWFAVTVSAIGIWTITSLRDCVKAFVVRELGFATIIA